MITVSGTVDMLHGRSAAQSPWSSKVRSVRMTSISRLGSIPNGDVFGHARQHNEPPMKWEGARAGHDYAVQVALREEEDRIRAEDEAYCKPLLQELEALRHEEARKRRKRRR